MTETERELEGQLGFLTEQVELLTGKVGELSARLHVLESEKSIAQKPDDVQAVAE